MSDFLELTSCKHREILEKRGLNNAIDMDVTLIDSLTGVPLLGSVMKIWKAGYNFSDAMFIKKICRFLDASEGYTDVEFNSFYEEMTLDNRSTLADFLINSISLADHKDKVVILGYLYKSRVKKQIDQSMLFRLCTVVNRCYTADFLELQNYCKINVSSSYVSDALFNVGLLANLGFDGGTASSSGGTRYQLNEIGDKLYNILKKERWFIMRGSDL